MRHNPSNDPTPTPEPLKPSSAATAPAEKEKETPPEEVSFTRPAEDEGASLVTPGIGMEDVPTPELIPDPALLNDQVFANKREAWEEANPESVKENEERDAAHAEGKPYNPEIKAETETKADIKAER